MMIFIIAFLHLCLTDFSVSAAIPSEGRKDNNSGIEVNQLCLNSAVNLTDEFKINMICSALGEVVDIAMKRYRGTSPKDQTKEERKATKLFEDTDKFVANCKKLIFNLLGEETVEPTEHISSVQLD